jgi:hypothetical protein
MFYYPVRLLLLHAVPNMNKTSLSLPSQLATYFYSKLITRSAKMEYPLAYERFLAAQGRPFETLISAVAISMPRHAEHCAVFCSRLSPVLPHFHVESRDILRRSLQPT